ncbi:MAG: hypothetical protein FWG71_06085 [Synergistaceae bacterium]|nr:hypothetical protein [Synergistaceae bacterium]
METKKNFYRVVLFLTIFSALLFMPDGQRAAEARNSRAWRERLSARTGTLWIEGQSLGDGIVLNARGELNVTWLERGLGRALETDKNVAEWVVSGLGYYHSSRRETRDKLRGRDVLVLNYRAVKNWSFDPAELTVDGYTITPDDILTRKEYWERELAPGRSGTVAVAAPSLKPGQTVELRYENSVIQLEVPHSRAR